MAARGPGGRVIVLVPTSTLTDRQRQAIAAYVLTPREREILAHIGRTGDTLAVTGSRLGISEQTVKNHCERVHRKLGVTGNLATFIALGWLKVPDPEEAADALGRSWESGRRAV